MFQFSAKALVIGLLWKIGLKNIGEINLVCSYPRKAVKCSRSRAATVRVFCALGALQVVFRVVSTPTRYSRFVLLPEEFARFLYPSSEAGVWLCI